MKTVIEMAREADRLTDERLQCPGEFHPDYGTVWNETFAALVREDEREACANTAYAICAETRHVTLGDKCAAAIRARGK